MQKFRLINVKISSDVAEKLKAKTGEKNVSAAIQVAVDHYLYCPVRSSERTEKTKGNRGRKPDYLMELLEKHGLEI
jgi:hypothetical protein